MQKCNVIIPVYNALDWVKKCIDALLTDSNIKCIEKLILVDDGSNRETKEYLSKISNPICVDYKDFLSKSVHIITNEKNLGFVTSVNKAFGFCLDNSTSSAVLLLNSDCLVAKNTLKKMLWHLKSDNEIAMISPLGCNMDSLSFDCFKNFSYEQMDKLFEYRFKHQQGESRAVFGNCLMIRTEVLREVGLFDEQFGRGYCEEVDLQYRTIKAGYKIKVALDCYVFHKAHASFGVSRELNKEKKANLKLFLERHEKLYMERTAKLLGKNAVLYAKSCLTSRDRMLPIKTGVAKINRFKQFELLMHEYINMAVYVLNTYGLKMMIKSVGNFICSIGHKKI